MTQETFGQAYGRGFVKTLRLLRSRGAPLHDAEDLAQAAWLQGWQKIHQLRDEGMIVRWINAIAINYHLRGIRREARFQALTDHCGQAGMDLGPIEAAKILECCNPADRRLFEHQLRGLTTQEIATKERVSNAAVRIRLFRARRAVRARLAAGV